MRTILKYTLLSIWWMLFTAFAIGIGITGISIYLPEILSSTNGWIIALKTLLLGLPFAIVIVNTVCLFSYLFSSDTEAVDTVEKEVIRKETRRNKRLERIIKKLENEGVRVELW